MLRESSGNVSGVKSAALQAGDLPKSKICGYFRHVGTVFYPRVRQSLTMTSCVDARIARLSLFFERGPMAFGLFRKRLPEPAAAVVEPPAVAPPAVAEAPGTADGDSAREILELLELELGAMIRQLERAANSVARGPEATATTLATIRPRTDALTGRTSAAQTTATTFSQAADKFTHSAQGIGSQVRDA